MYFALGMLVYQQAADAVARSEVDGATNADNARKEGVQLFREAAGIFEGTPTLNDNDSLRPLDTRTDVVTALSALCLVHSCTDRRNQNVGFLFFSRH